MTFPALFEVSTESGPVVVNLSNVRTIIKDRHGLAHINFQYSGGHYGGGIATNEEYETVIGRLAQMESRVR